MTAPWLFAWRRWVFALLALACTLLPLGARAADFTAGASFDGTVATLWMQSNVGSTWVDAHYNLDGGAQQNVRMTFNAATNRFETTFNAAAGQTANYAFTYNIGSAAYDSSWSSTVLTTSSAAATPTFTPGAGTYDAAQSISIASATPGATLYYTTDGSTPTTSSPQYTVPFTVSASETVKAIATAPGLSPSAVGSAAYVISTGTGGSGGGSGSGNGYTEGVDVSGATATVWFAPTASTQWVDVHYDIGSGLQNLRMTWNAATSRFEQPVTVSAGTTLQYSFTWYTTAATDTPTYTFTVGASQVATPSITPAGGSFAGPQAVTLSDTTSGAVIHYTTDGSTPTASSPVYGGAFTVSASATVKALATASGMSDSAVASASFTITQPVVATPTFSPAGGSYSSAQSVTLGDTTSGATVHYTTDGSAPTSASPVYTSPIQVAVTTTIKAIAMAAGMTDSAAASATYTISGSGGGNGYVQGVSELGSTATVWFKPAAAMNFVILHYQVGTSSQINPQMAWNSSLSRYETVLSNLSPGQVITYSFTYSPVSGAQQDTPAYTYTMGTGNGIPKPTFSPAGGSYTTAQTVTLATTATNATILYTLDGSAPNPGSPQYTGPLTVDKPTTINAISQLTDGSESAVASATYIIGSTGGAVAAPVFSLAGGTYGTHLRLTMTSATVGATLHYTTDGSAPTATSPIYGGPVEISATTTVRALAQKAGMTDSPVTSATYTLTGNGSSAWNGMTTFTVANGTHGKWADNQVYWAIIGKDWNTGQFVHVDASGHLVPMSLGDNGALTKNGLPYSDYFFTLDQVKSLTIPPINSARLLMSVGGPMYIWVNQDVNGNIGYAGANIENPDDPNIDVTFDFGEFAILPPGTSPQGLFVNTTRVDQFGFPVQLQVTGLDGFSATVGEPLTESRDELFARFIGENPPEFAALAQAPYAPYRIVAPAHATFKDGAANATYLDSYITQVWNQYATQDLVIDLKNGWAPFTGRVEGNVFHFTDANGGNYYINGKPTTSMVLLGDGLLNDPSGASDVGKQLQLQAQMCAALNRQVAQRAFADWWNSTYFYPAGQPANWYAKFWHDHSVDALSYGFAYDDVGSYSPSVHTEAPVSVTFTVGW